MGDLWKSRVSAAATRGLGLRVISLFLTAITAVLFLGAGVASAADPLIGRKYSDAASRVSSWNGKPVVATVSGSQVTLDDCIVISWSKGGFLNSRGKNDRRNEYYMHLNCNNPVASAGHPGSSVMTPQGAKRKQQEEWAAAINKNPDQCHKSESALENCRNFCKFTGLCEVEI